MRRLANSAATDTAINVSERDLLPTNVVPRHYQLDLEPDLDNFTFNGKALIDLDVAEDSNFITLNSKEIVITSVKVTPQRKGIWYVNAHCCLAHLRQDACYTIQKIRSLNTEAPDSILRFYY